MSSLLPALLTSLAATSSPAVLITEIMYDPASPERNGEPEWVEIANLGPTPVDLSGWKLDDEDSADWGLLDGSLKAGGVGLNLTGADHVVHFDPWWNPAAEAQATDRAHRIGQTKTVHVHKLIVTDSVEENVLQLQTQKRKLLQDVFEASEIANAPISIDDLKALL